MQTKKGSRTSNLLGSIRQRRHQLNTNDNGADFALMDLNDDLLLHVLSFVSYAPFESSDQRLVDDYVSPKIPTVERKRPMFPKISRMRSFVGKSPQPQILPKCKLSPSSVGTLTHVLPLVCTRFLKLCRESDTLWKEAMYRLSNSSPSIWEYGISQLAMDEGQQNLILPESLVDRCDRALVNCGGAKQLFQCLVKEYDPFTSTAPLVYLRQEGPPPLHQCCVLQLSGRTYRFMVKHLMRGHKGKNGRLLPKGNRPWFLVTSGIASPMGASPMGPEDPCFQVEILRCKWNLTGRVDLTIKPIKVVRIQSIQQRPKPHPWVDATVRMASFTHKRGRLPVYYVGGVRRVPELYRSLKLDFQKHKYEQLIESITSHPASKGVRPRFVLSHQDALAGGEAIALVEIRRTILTDNAHIIKVELVPIAVGRIIGGFPNPSEDGMMEKCVNVFVDGPLH